MKSFLVSLFLLFLTCSLTAQVGIGTTSPNGSLDVVSTDDGLLIPRVALTATNVSTVITPTVSELVYNTATSAVGPNQVTPGYYYWDGSLWIRLATGNSSNAWALLGNASTSAATNFLGTTDNIDLVFRRNNIRAGFIGDPIYNLSTFDSNNGNTSFGANSLLNPTINVGTQTGVRNTVFGANVMPGLTTGQRNTGIGDLSLFSNTSGSENIAVGTGALYSNTISSGHVAIGRSALTSYNGPATADIGNTAVGFTSLRDNVVGTGNSALGYRALRASTGSNNTALGFDSGLALTTGSNNIMIGANTVAPVAAGSDQLNIGNTIFGTMAGALTSGVNTTRTIGINVTAPQGALDIVSSNNGLLIPRINLTFGANLPQPLPAPADSEMIYVLNSVGAGVNAVTPGFYHWNSASARWVRFNTGASTGWLTTGNTGIIDGTNFIGTAAATDVDVAFRRNNLAAGKIASTSTSFGLNALTVGATTNGTAFGVNALAANTAANNTAFGTNALAANTTSANNTAFGFNALAINTPGSDTGALNTAVGSGALANLNGGNNNTAVGYNALTNVPTTTRFNTAVGSNALSGVNSAASINNVAVGYNTMTGTGVITESVAVGSGALSAASNGSTRNTAIGFQAGSATTSGTDNVFIGYAAGSSEAVTSSNKLYIENTNANANNALIYGDFFTNILRVNGTLQVNTPGVNGYALPNVPGAAGQILQTNGAGATSWVSAATVETDPQVSSATVNRMPKWNGTTLVDGIVTDNGTTVTVAGTTSTTNFQMTAGATANYILQSDGVGNGSWANPTVKPYVNTGAATGVYTVSLAEYTVRVFNAVSEIRLPNAAGNTGKVYVIIGSNTIGPKIFSTAGGAIYNDVGNVFINTLNANTRYTVQSDGVDWIVIGQ
ncbi:beta strand repeat-containing protein [Flavobacterium sp. RSB2_4_14]|uniref:beta strand repeat-containing protein n=1 Tax=Flavobacterium sp. RSB2_4_14 TaxID=3447665 RepID=UPI003F3FB3D2